MFKTCTALPVSICVPANLVKAHYLMEAVNVYNDRVLSNRNCYMLNPFISDSLGPRKGYLNRGLYVHTGK